MTAPGTPPQGSPPQGPPQAPPYRPSPAWRTEPARRIAASENGSWRRGVSVIGIVLVVLAVLLAAAMLVVALRQLVGTTLQPTSAALPAEVSSLTVVANHGDLILRAGDDPVVRTTGPGASFNEGRIAVDDLGGGDVEVTISTPQRWFTAPVGPRSASAYEIVVPVGLLDDVTLQTELGDIRADHGAPALRMQTDVGDITAEGIAADQLLSARSSLGDISVAAGASGRIDATTDMGDVTVDLSDATTLPAQVTAVSDLGDVAVTMPPAPADRWYRAEVASDVGDAHDGTRTRTPVPGGTETVIVAETATGSVRVTER